MVGNNLFWTVADILQHVYLVRYLTLIVADMHFMVLYLGKIPIISMYVVIFPVVNPRL